MRQAAQQQLDIDGLRAQITQQLRSNAAFSQTVYRDQPIIMTGKQLRSYVPDAISTARQIARHPNLRHESAAKVFYAQARNLAGYEDDFEYAGTFLHYYPTYEDMSNEQLRGYFSWRTKVRHGHIERGSLSFAYLYLYELINLISVTSAQEGYAAMHAFGSAYAQIEPSIKRYLNTWLDDFVIYYQLDPSLLSTMRFDEQDAAYQILANRNEYTDAELFEAICSLSSYRIVESPFFLEHDKELRTLVARAYRLVAEHHDSKLKTTLIDKLFGRIGFEIYRPFEQAVFADPLAVRQADYEITPLDTIYCREGIWHRARYASLEAPCPWLSKLLETTESILRDAYEFPNTLSQPITTKYIVKSISAQAAEFAARYREAQERAVHIDMSKLEHIRSASEATCEKLIVEEEELEQLAIAEVQENQPEPAEQAPLPVAIESSAESFSSPLTPLEHELVLTMLAQGSVHDFERKNTCIASVLIDSINEKLYDEFADICIDASAGQPEIIEDYIEELKELLAA